jgi:hypothetical protein
MALARASWGAAILRPYKVLADAEIFVIGLM